MECYNDFIRIDYLKYAKLGGFNMRRIGHSLYGKDRLDDELAKQIADSGLKVLELDMSAEDYPTADFHKTAEIAKKYGLEIVSIHLPIAPQHIYDVTHKYAENKRL